MRVAAIDLGSNSFHMLVGEVQGPTSFATVVQDKMMIQLGKTALVTGKLDPQAMERGLRCLDEFRRMALARRVERTLAVATSAIREAENGEEFLRRAREERGITIRLISGREEARLIHLAVSRHVELREKALLIDIGGGSVELTVGDGASIYYSTSVKLGFLRLHGRFVSGDPMTRRESRTITSFVIDSLKSPLGAIRKHEPKLVVGTSGSITTLLRLAQMRRTSSSSDTADASVVRRSELREILGELMDLPAIERANKFDLDPLRAEYLPTALLLLDALLEGIEADRLTICSVALREGLIYDFIARAKPVADLPRSNGDLRFQAILDLAGRCEYPIDHSHQVAQLAKQLFQQTRELHGLGEREERLLEYGSILHDIGYHIGYAKHHKHAFYLVMNSDLRGFSPEERSILANLVRYHRRASPKSKHAGMTDLAPKTRRTVKYLTAILRIADGLDMSHFSAVDQVQCVAGKRSVRFHLVLNPMYTTAQLDLWAAKKHARYFEKLFGVETIFTARRARKPVAAAAS
jgi:exopolyphosphatase/guanosine-5'-triphosphate,3'-diphosphate pyrophosphatase